MQIVLLDSKALRPWELDLSPLKELGTLSLYDRTDPSMVVQRLRGADVVLTNKVPIKKEMLVGNRSLKHIAVLATGYDGIDVKGARELGIPVSNVPGYATESVAHHTVALLLELSCHISHHDKLIRQGLWAASADFCWWDRAPMSLTNKTMGIIGCGSIGSRVGEIAVALGMKVIGYSPREKKNFPGRQVSLEELWSESDVISLHCPAKTDNKGFINRETIAKMKEGAILLNTARGALVNESDVAAALESGRLGGYGADVVGSEPITVHNPLLKAPHCYLSGHCAWAALENRQRIIDVTAQSIRGIMQGQPVNLVN